VRDQDLREELSAFLDRPAERVLDRAALEGRVAQLRRRRAAATTVLVAAVVALVVLVPMLLLRPSGTTGTVEPAAPPAPSSSREPVGEPAPVPDDLRRLAEAFIAYARGDAEAFPHGNSLALSLGGQVALLRVDDVAAVLANRRTWRICPPGQESYGASSCPVDLLGPVVAAEVNGTPLVFEPDLGEVVCAPPRSGPMPEGRVVVVRPAPESRACALDFALALVADRQGRLTAVDLTLSAP